MEHPTPPPGWPQRAGRTVPFPPGDGADEWEIVLDGEVGEDRVTYQVNCATGEVYRAEGERWYQPPWMSVPPAVRRRVWVASAHSCDRIAN